MLKNNILSAVGDYSGPPSYIDDKFSITTYAGSGTAAQTVTTGVDLTGGGLLWLAPYMWSGPGRPYNYFTNNSLTDMTSNISTILTRGSYQVGEVVVSSFSPTGFSLPPCPSNNGDFTANAGGVGHVSYSFRKSPGFFDLVRYTGDGQATRSFPHILGASPGFVMALGSDGNWYCYHSSYPSQSIQLTDQPTTSMPAGQKIGCNSSTLQVSGVLNTTRFNHVAYLWSTGPDTEFGSFNISANGSEQFGGTTGNRSLQYVMIKSLTSAGDWEIYDDVRGVGGLDTFYVSPNSIIADKDIRSTVTQYPGDPPGIVRGKVRFASDGRFFYTGNAGTYIYMAFKSPNRPVTSGSEIFTALQGANNGNGLGPVYRTNHRADFIINTGDPYTGYDGSKYISIRGLDGYSGSITSNAFQPDFERTLSFSNGCYADGVGYTNPFYASYAEGYNTYAFRKAAGVVGISVEPIRNDAGWLSSNHGLNTVVPEMVFYKSAFSGGRWLAKCMGYHMFLDGNEPAATVFEEAYGTGNLSNGYIDNVGAVSMSLNQGVAGRSNIGPDNSTAVVLSFATLAGVSKVGKYVGNGTSLVVDCGFTTGARFIMIKSVGESGGWIFWDYMRGIVEGNDPHSNLNDFDMPVITDDSVDPHPQGFIVNQASAAAVINTTGAMYVYLAIS